MPLTGSWSLKQVEQPICEEIVCVRVGDLHLMELGLILILTLLEMDLLYTLQTCQVSTFINTGKVLILLTWLKCKCDQITALIWLWVTLVEAVWVLSRSVRLHPGYR